MSTTKLTAKKFHSQEQRDSECFSVSIVDSSAFQHSRNGSKGLEEKFLDGDRMDQPLLLFFQCSSHDCLIKSKVFIIIFVLSLGMDRQ